MWISEQSNRPDSSRPPRRNNQPEVTGAAPTRRSPGDPIPVPHTTAASQFLYGASAVLAALKAGKRKLYKLYLHHRAARDADADSAFQIKRLAEKAGVELVQVQDDFLRVMDKMAYWRPHNGCVLEASPLPKLPVAGLGEVSPSQSTFAVIVGHQSKEERDINGSNDKVPYNSHGWRQPFVLLLDHVVDQGNLGAVMRTAYFLGVDAVAISTHASASLTPAATKASAGAAEVVQTFAVEKPNEFVEMSRNNGWQIFAAEALEDPNSPKGRSAADFQQILPFVAMLKSRHGKGRIMPFRTQLAEQPCLLMLGGEGEGLTKKLRSLAHYEVGIPSVPGKKDVGVDSLNVSVAGALLCMEFLRKPADLKTQALPDTSNDEQEKLFDISPAFAT